MFLRREQLAVLSNLSLKRQLSPPSDQIIADQVARALHGQVLKMSEDADYSISQNDKIFTRSLRDPATASLSDEVKQFLWEISFFWEVFTVFSNNTFLEIKFWQKKKWAYDSKISP